MVSTLSGSAAFAFFLCSDDLSGVAAYMRITIHSECKASDRRRHELPAAFSTAVGPVVASLLRSNSFPFLGKSYKESPIGRLYFQSVGDGTLVALGKGRRSGAQRGASENNFGQRFSVSTPCFIPQKRTVASALPNLVRTHVSGSFFWPIAVCCRSRPLEGTPSPGICLLPYQSHHSELGL